MVSLHDVGNCNFSNDGGNNFHMSVSETEGRVMGGPVIAGRVFTTLELYWGQSERV